MNEAVEGGPPVQGGHATITIERRWAFAGLAATGLAMLALIIALVVDDDARGDRGAYGPAAMHAAPGEMPSPPSGGGIPGGPGAPGGMPGGPGGPGGAPQMQMPQGVPQQPPGGQAPQQSAPQAPQQQAPQQQSPGSGGSNGGGRGNN